MFVLLTFEAVSGKVLFYTLDIFLTPPKSNPLSHRLPICEGVQKRLSLLLRIADNMIMLGYSAVWLWSRGAELSSEY